MRRFEIGPLIVAVGSLVLLVSLFLDWYGDFTAWELFEVTDVLLAALALAALVAAAGLIAPELGYLDRGWLLGSVAAIAVLVVAEILSPPPAAAGAELDSGAWIAFAAALVMLVGAVLSLGRISFSVAIEGREPRQRVSAVDHRPPTTEAGPAVERDATETTVAVDEPPPPSTQRARKR